MINGVKGTLRPKESGTARYVAGFVFRDDKVLLVRKNRPHWQAGYLNGIGGEIQHGELSYNAMLREYKEETGRELAGWNLFCIEEGPGYEVYFYRLTLPNGFLWEPPAHNDVGEELTWQPRRPKEPFIGNLHWLLPLAEDPREIIAMVKTYDNIKEIGTW